MLADKLIKILKNRKPCLNSELILPNPKDNRPLSKIVNVVQNYC
ncbi:hypothetical protein OTSGILL_0223 [Orientia tsutsugamushi str. Gilliam]|uniref:Uncharacterized protein n=1 Tax=Orientia tsutsugamushi str. Gilliam TaxID=1359184 RepID=A0A0F3MDZ5_ORITS|nr:hypothetical protein OTSGILL_0223 [Orientia tsutsugamushi str. Gilliam]